MMLPCPKCGRYSENVTDVDCPECAKEESREQILNKFYEELTWWNDGELKKILERFMSKFEGWARRDERKKIKKDFERFLIEEVGKRCTAYDKDCFVCRAWARFDEIFKKEAGGKT